MAFVGAALFAGSVLHPHNLAVGRGTDDVRRWLSLPVVRIACLLPIMVLSHLRAAQVAASLRWGRRRSIRPNSPCSTAIDRAPSNASLRWGWLLLPVRFGIALMLR